MKKNTKKKFRDIRNAVVMMCVMVAMMSTASYAWFTMSDSPTVTGMKMTAATAGGGLEVANVTAEAGSADQYFSSINIKDNEIKTLKPVTPDVDNVGTFKKPIYQGNTVKTTVAITDAEEPFKNYVAKYEFWLHSTSTTDEYVGLIFGDSNGSTAMGLANGDGTLPNIDGSFVRKSLSETASDKSTINPSYAVRVGLVPREVTSGAVTDKDGYTVLNKMIIWEPNAEKEATTNRAESSVVDDNIDEDITVRSRTTGEVMSLTDNSYEENNYTSDALFKLTGDAAVRIEMYVWLEGSDNECGDEIQAGNLEAQIQFTPVEATATP